MPTIKCPKCSLVNFATMPFCKRCNFSLVEMPPSNSPHQTNLNFPADGTRFRELPPNPPQFQPNIPPGNNAREPKFFYQQSPVGNSYQNHQHAPPPYQYDLPQFPQGQYQPQFNQFQNQQFYHPQEVAYRKLGKEIALHKNGNLPEICVKCGEDLTVYNGGALVAQKFRWHHPALYVALISPIIYLILSLCLSERATINVPLCGEHIKSRDNAKSFLICGGVISTFLVILLFNLGAVGFGILLFMGALIGLTAVSEYSYKPVRIKKSEGSYYHLAGASDRFLSRLPF